MSGYRWMNEPETWVESDGTLSITTSSESDLWGKCVEGVQRSTAHMYGQEVEGEFEVQIRVRGDFQTQYDQVGLILYQDDENWMKLSVELMDGNWNNMFPYPPKAGVINAAYCRHGWPEWSVIPYDPELKSWWLRIRRYGPTVICSFSRDGENFELMKMCSFPESDRIFVARYAGSPISGGYTATLDNYRLTQA